MAIIGYARVSTADQDLALQLDALRAAGCKQIFQEKAGASGKRPQLAAALLTLKHGDTLCVWRLDRLGRSVGPLLDLTADLERRSVSLRSLTEGLDQSTPAGRCYFTMLGALAQMERELIQERTMAGLAAARARGRVGGRPHALSKRKLLVARDLFRAGRPAREIADVLRVSLATLYRRVPAEYRQLDAFPVQTATRATSSTD